MLVNMRDLLADAQNGNYAVGSFSVANMEMVLGVLKAAEELKAPVILQIAEVRLKQSPLEIIGPLMVAAAEAAQTPVAVHFDHGKTIEKISQALDLGFTSVMFDGSHLPLEENIAETKKVIALAEQYDASVEAEIGCVGGSEDGSEDIAINCTKPQDAVRFAEETGVEALAIAIGNAHGNYKSTPKLRFDILDEVSKRLPNFPIVLHGASSVSQKYVKIIQENGGQLADAIGIPEDMLRQAARSAVCKINIDSDLRLAMTAGIREVLYNNPAAFDPREYLKVGRANVKTLVAHKIKNVLGSENKA